MLHNEEMLVRLFGLLVCGAALHAQARVDTYKVLATYPHDHAAYTQGLEFVDGKFYEGTGLHGESTIRIVTPTTGTVVKKQPIAYMYFGEGITLFGGRMFELTWQNATAFVYNPATFQKTGEYHYTGEGWGLTHDSKQLIMSDGTASIRFLDPATFKETGRIYVRDGARPIQELNELEYIEGEIWANVYQTNLIARINPMTGAVNSWIDMTGLLPVADSKGVDVLNGIAYDAKGKHIFVTGKLWPKLFEIQVVTGKAK
jgi:glutaminyl-peptide cyclotransferase